MSPCSAAVTYPEHKSFCEKTQTKLNQTKAKQKTPNPQQQRNTTNKKNPTTKNPPNNPTNIQIFCSSLTPKALPGRDCCLFSSPGRDWEKFCLRLTQLQPQCRGFVTDFPLFHSCSDLPFSTTKPQIHPHVTLLAVGQGAPRPVPLSRREGVVHRSL